MYQEDFNQMDNDECDISVSKHNIAESRNKDKGLNILTRRVEYDDGTIKRKRIKVYTSSGTGRRIRDAETGHYYDNKVGSKDEDLFFKVAIATGECTSANNSNTLFYLSPQHYEKHLYGNVDPERAMDWEEKRDLRLNTLSKVTKPTFTTVVVK